MPSSKLELGNKLENILDMHYARHNDPELP